MQEKEEQVLNQLMTVLHKCVVVDRHEGLLTLTVSLCGIAVSAVVVVVDWVVHWRIDEGTGVGRIVFLQQAARTVWRLCSLSYKLKNK